MPSISFWSVPAIVLRLLPRGFLERERRLTESVLLLSFASSIACKPLWTWSNDFLAADWRSNRFPLVSTFIIWTGYLKEWIVKVSNLNWLWNPLKFTLKLISGIVLRVMVTDGQVAHLYRFRTFCWRCRLRLSRHQYNHGKCWAAVIQLCGQQSMCCVRLLTSNLVQLLHLQ